MRCFRDISIKSKLMAICMLTSGLVLCVAAAAFVANELITHNIQRKPKSLWSQADRGDLTVRYRGENEHDEAWFVASEIDRWTPIIKKAGVSAD